jgi:glycosyltransferase involved in cell wall biosynthesis
MNEINLSYVITTRNKLPYLKEVMKRLLANVQDDEEIIVIDAASTDGTVEYLTDLYKQGRIHQFISEPDKGESHGYNKGFLMARGKLLKDITDDDAYYYPAIQECKKFMLEHEEVDFMSANTAEINLEDSKDLNSFRVLTVFEHFYRRWLENGTVATFSGLPFMIRRKSLALTGLYFTGIINPDLEYSLRITNLNVNIAWNTALLSVRIDNPRSNLRALKLQLLFAEDKNRLFFFYDGDYRKKYLKKMLRSYLDLVKQKVITLVSSRKAEEEKDNLLGKKDRETNLETEENLAELFNMCDEFMGLYNSQNISEIITKS